MTTARVLSPAQHAVLTRMSDGHALRRYTSGRAGGEYREWYEVAGRRVSARTLRILVERGLVQWQGSGAWDVPPRYELSELGRAAIKETT